MQILLAVVLFIGALFGFNWLMGYKKGYITFQLDDRYFHFNEYVSAVKEELIKRGKNVSYEGNRIFLINDVRYVLIERNVSMGGVPLQHTVLKPLKKSAI